MQSPVLIGIDLGGTKIEGIALAGESRAGDRPTAELCRLRVPTPRDDYDAGIAAIGQLVDDIERRIGKSGRVGIGIPGSISPATGLVRNANSTWLNGRPFVADVARRLGREVRVANDANCFTLSEAVDGAGQGARAVFGVILGTGVGGGLVVDGRPLDGRNGIAGEWGHTPLPQPSGAERAVPPCWCGRSGCIETFLSGPAITRDHHRHSGRERDAAAIAAAADSDGPEATACRATLARHLDRLARALAMVVNIVDPDVIVLGGGLSQMAHLHRDLPARLTDLVFSDVFDTPVRPAVHGDSSGVRGAAWLWAD